MSVISITFSTTKVMRKRVQTLNVACVEAVPADAERINIGSCSANDIMKALYELGGNKRGLYKHSNERSRALFVSRIICNKLCRSRFKRKQDVRGDAVIKAVFTAFKESLKAARKVRYRLPSQVMRASCARAVALRTFTPRASARQTHKQSTKHKDDSGGTGSDSDSASSNDLLLYYLIRIRPRPARHRATCTSLKLESAAAMPHCPYKKEVQQS